MQAAKTDEISMKRQNNIKNIQARRHNMPEAKPKPLERQIPSENKGPSNCKQMLKQLEASSGEVKLESERGTTSNSSSMAGTLNKSRAARHSSSNDGKHQ